MTQQGYFNDPVGRRLATDLDGTRAFTIPSNSNVASDQSNTLVSAANGSGGPSVGGDGGLNNSPSSTTIYFPEKRDLTHMFMNWYGGNSTFGQHYFAGCDISSDSTAPLNGTFTNVPFTVGGNDRNPYAFNHQGVIAVRFRFILQNGVGYAYWQMTALYIWGQLAAGTTPHRLEFVDANGTRLPIDFDYGDVPKGSTRIWGPGNTYNETSPVYIKNLSSQKTANSVLVAVDPVQGNEMNGVDNISTDNVTFTSTINFSSIPPNGTVGPLFVKYAPPSSTALGLKICRIKSTVASWT